MLGKVKFFVGAGNLAHEAKKSIFLTTYKVDTTGTQFIFTKILNWRN